MELSYWGVVWLILVPGILYASWVDGVERRVPNWLNGVLLLLGLVAQYSYFGLPGLQSALLGALLGLGVLIVPWLVHGMGAGDVKLMAAIGCWFGPVMTLWAFVAGALIGGVLAMAMILLHGKFRSAMANMATIVDKMSTPSQWFTDYGGARSFGTSSMLLPYGIPLTMGSILVLSGHGLGWWRF